MPQHRLIILSLLVGTALILAGVCCMQAAIPDQSGYRPLDDLRTSGQAVARLYAAPIPNLTGIATHSWFASSLPAQLSSIGGKSGRPRAGHTGTCGRTCKLPSPTWAPAAHLFWREMTGPSAEPIVAFVASQSPTYPCRNEYAYLGVNSNTYIQWVLNQTNWQVALPDTAIGKHAGINCP